MAIPLLVQAELTSTTGFPEDSIVNTWAVTVPDFFDFDTDLLNLTGPLNTFYAAFGATWSNTHNRGAGTSTQRIYNLTGHLDGSPHGSPVAEDSISILIASGSATDLPRQVALVATLRAVGADTAPVEIPDSGDAGLERDRPKSRLSGRVFLGPFNNTVLAGTGRPTAGTVTGLLNGLNTLHDNWAAGLVEWCVWSRKNAAMVPVERVEMDDTFDTIRTRCLRPVTRSSVTV